MVSTISSDHSDSDLRDFLIAAAGVEFFMLAFFYRAKIYDLSTGMFFAFALGFLARGHVRSFLLLYPIACINRETTFLLTAIYAALYFRKLPAGEYLLGIGYQCLTFVSVRWILKSIYEGNPGEPFYFWPARVLYDYENQIVLTVAFIIICSMVGYFVCRNWRQKPVFLRSAFLCLFPILMVLHLAMGMAFEIRVFAEVFPVAWALSWSS